MSASGARRCATPLFAAVCALALMPVPASGQAPPSSREQLVWHWFGACASSDSLILEFHLDGKLVYSSTFPICHVRRSDIRPEPQQRLLTFDFDAAPHRFGTQYRASEPEPITAISGRPVRGGRGWYWECRSPQRNASSLIRVMR